MERKQPALSNYFIKEDFYETVSKNIFKADRELVNKKYIYKSGAIYVGQWLGGFRHGKGEMVFPDKSKYTGSFNLGNAHGDGIFEFPDGGTYEGQWYGNCSHGNGTLTEVDGSEYQG